MGTVRVTRLLVEYVAGSKLFTLELDPDAIGSLVLRDRDLAKITTALPGNGSHRPSATALLRPQLTGAGEHGILKEGTPALADASEASPADGDFGLWWHVNSCSWFHPE